LTAEAPPLVPVGVQVQAAEDIHQTDLFQQFAQPGALFGPRRFTMAVFVKTECRMSEPTTMSSKGQVTIPRELRERLGLQAGDKIAWSLLSNGTVVARPKTRRLVDLVGMLTQPGQPGVSVEEMRLPE
jgi:AbrB family looped-hinge helix DNA binding protein